MSKAFKSLIPILVASAMLGEGVNNSYPSERQQKERTIRKCADPKKKAKRKLRQASQRSNRR